MSELDAVQSRLVRCESRMMACQGVCNELRELTSPLSASMSAEVEHVFEERLRDELSARSSVFLDNEGVNFVDFVNDLEEGAAGRINAHLQSALRDRAPSQPDSAPLSSSAPAFAASSTEAQSAEVAPAGPGGRHAVCAPGSSGDITAFQADVIGDGAELGSTLFDDVEEQ